MGTAKTAFVCRFPSAEVALDATDRLHVNGLWVQRYDDRVVVSVPPGRQADRVERSVLHILRAGDVLVVDGPRKVAWDEELRCFVDPCEPGIDAATGAFVGGADFDATASTWEVVVRPRSIFVHRGVREQLVLLRRPFLDATGEQYVLGALDAADAEAIATAAGALDDVREATTRPLGRLARWRLRQRFAGNYAGRSPDNPFSGGF